MLKEVDVITHPSPVSCAALPHSTQPTTLFLYSLPQPTIFSSFNLSVSRHTTHRPEVHIPFLSNSLSPSISLTLRSLALCSRQALALLLGLLHPSYFQSVLGLAHGSTSCFSGTGSFEHLNTLVWGPPLPLFGSHPPFCTRYVELVYKTRQSWK